MCSTVNRQRAEYTLSDCHHEGPALFQNLTAEIQLQQKGVPYSSKFSWHNIFVKFVIRHPITKIVLTKI